MLVASVARWEEHLRMLIVLERECLELKEEIEHMSEKQELLATLMEGKMSVQKVAPASEEFQRQIFQGSRKQKEALELLVRKYILVKKEHERD